MRFLLPVLVLALALCTTSKAQLLDLSLELGIAASVSANTETKIIYGVTGQGAELTITTDSDAQVTLSAVATLSSSLPEGHSSLAFSTGQGFKLEVSGGSTVSATLKTPPLSLAAQAILTGEAEAGCFRLDAASQSYTQVAIESVNSDNSITLALPVEGTYVFVTLEANLPVPTLYGEARVTAANEYHVFSYPGGFVLGAATTSDNSISCERKFTSDTPAPAGQLALGAFFDIELATEETVQAQLNFTYDAAAVAAAGIAESSLRLMFKAEGGVWTTPDSVVVDTEAKVVVASTTHFSEWGLFGSALLGVAVSVTANTATSIEFEDGTMLEVTTDSDADVTLKAVVTATVISTASLPDGATELSFGAHGGLELMVEGGSFVYASVTSAPLSAQSQALITSDTSVGCFRFNAESQTYAAVEIEEYTADKKITVALPAEGIYMFVGLDATAALSVPVLALYGEAKATVAGEMKSFVFEGGLQIGVKTQTNNAITVTRSESDDSNPPAGKIGLGFVLVVDLQTEETVEGSFELAYDAAAVAAKGIAEASLKLMFKSESGEWQEPDSLRVDTSAKVIVATTSHFSRWSVYGDPSDGEGEDRDSEENDDDQGSEENDENDISVEVNVDADSDAESAAALRLPEAWMHVSVLALSCLLLLPSEA